MWLLSCLDSWAWALVYVVVGLDVVVIVSIKGYFHSIRKSNPSTREESSD